MHGTNFNNQRFHEFFASSSIGCRKASSLFVLSCWRIHWHLRLLTMWWWHKRHKRRSSTVTTMTCSHAHAQNSLMLHFALCSCEHDRCASNAHSIRFASNVHRMCITTSFMWKCLKSCSVQFILHTPCTFSQIRHFVGRMLQENVLCGLSVQLKMLVIPTNL